MTGTGSAPAFILRDALPEDFAAITAIYAHHVTTGFGTFEEVPPSESEMRERFEYVRSLGLPYLVAEAAGRIAGYAYAGPYRPRSAYRHTAEDSIYVAPEFQGRGIGAALLGAVAQRCAAGGVRQLVAVIGDSANLASIRVHEKCGFRHVGVLTDVGFKAGRWVDTVLMQLSVPAAS